jgi:hypothetical protein
MKVSLTTIAAGVKRREPGTVPVPETAVEPPPGVGVIMPLILPMDPGRMPAVGSILVLAVSMAMTAVGVQLVVQQADMRYHLVVGIKSLNLSTIPPLQNK